MTKMFHEISSTKSKAKSPNHNQKIDEETLIDHVGELMNAARCGEDDTILQLYLRQLDLTRTDEDGNTALHIAAMVGQMMNMIYA
uniref:ANK_REP_REGION domain-containing protein n=1 Tax=Heterorhabditis bacteriophora TaxID=37862 RepID=A0A1I7X4J6_HETBA